MSSKPRAPLLPFWYLCLGAGFFLLGLHRLLLGAPAWAVALRWLIAAGFLLLACAEFRSRRPPPKLQ